MKLTDDDRGWVAAYEQELTQRFPGQVRHLWIYGSKARGDATPNSDLDVLLIVSDQAAGHIRQMRRLGYRLDPYFLVSPSIVAYTESEWEPRRRSGSPYREALERDAVAVA